MCWWKMLLWWSPSSVTSAWSLWWTSHLRLLEVLVRELSRLEINWIKSSIEVIFWRSHLIHPTRVTSAHRHLPGYRVESSLRTAVALRWIHSSKFQNMLVMAVVSSHAALWRVEHFARNCSIVGWEWLRWPWWSSHSRWLVHESILVVPTWRGCMRVHAA